MEKKLSVLATALLLIEIVFAQASQELVAKNKTIKNNKKQLFRVKEWIPKFW